MIIKLRTFFLGFSYTSKHWLICRLDNFYYFVTYLYRMFIPQPRLLTAILFWQEFDKHILVPVIFFDRSYVGIHFSSFFYSITVVIHWMTYWKKTAQPCSDKVIGWFKWIVWNSSLEATRCRNAIFMRQSDDAPVNVVVQEKCNSLRLTILFRSLSIHSEKFWEDCCPSERNCSDIWNVYQSRML